MWLFSKWCDNLSINGNTQLENKPEEYLHTRLQMALSYSRRTNESVWTTEAKKSERRGHSSGSKLRVCSCLMSNRVESKEQDEASGTCCCWTSPFSLCFLSDDEWRERFLQVESGSVCVSNERFHLWAVFIEGPGLTRNWKSWSHSLKADRRISCSE